MNFIVQVCAIRFELFNKSIHVKPPATNFWNRTLRPIRGQIATPLFRLKCGIFVMDGTVIALINLMLANCSYVLHISNRTYWRISDDSMSFLLIAKPLTLNVPIQTREKERNGAQRIMPKHISWPKRTKFSTKHMIWWKPIDRIAQSRCENSIR